MYRLTDNIVVLRFSHRWCKITYVFIHPFYLQSLLEQELGYHKQIARKLRAQYVEGIYDNPVTLKCRLRVIQGSLETEPLGRSYTTCYKSSYLTLNIIVTLKR